VNSPEKHNSQPQPCGSESLADEQPQHPPQAIELLFLGTGTSHGVPVIGCDCHVCRSDNPRNVRTRTSILLRLRPHNINILIDTAIDLRQQMLRERVSHVDAILFTHHHADHILGLDDIRVFSDRQGRIDCYAPPASAERIKSVFSYAFNSPEIPDWGGLPRLNLKLIDGHIDIFGQRIIPLRLPHGRITVYGYRIGKLAYLTDCKSVPDEAMEQLHDLDVLVIDALRHHPHPTHLSIDEALEAAAKINAARTFFTHICHRVDHDTLAASLPPHIQPAYDGLVVNVKA